MSKHRLSTPSLPPAKRLHIVSGANVNVVASSTTLSSSFYDELMLFIFSHLSFMDLCTVQAVSLNWARLAADNQLWKALYLREYGRNRLRGGRGFFGRTDGREIKPLPGMKGTEEVKDWKWMFRISSNWKTGRCKIQQISNPLIPHMDEIPGRTHVLLAGPLTIAGSSCPSHAPPITLMSPSHPVHVLHHSTHPEPCHITSLAVDQAPPSTSTNILRLASFLSTGEFTIFSINHHTLSLSSATLMYTPRAQTSRTSPIIQASYHHPLLITLSKAFHVSIYDLEGDVGITHMQTLTSFTSFPPTSLVLSKMSTETYKLVLAYAIPVYPAHWSVGATELIISASHSSFSTSLLTPSSPMAVLATRTTRAFDTPSGWIDEAKMARLREQWGRKMKRVGGCETDGKWVVLAPAATPFSFSSSSSTSENSSDGENASSPSPPSRPPSPLTWTFASPPSPNSPTSLQLYRLSLPSSTSSHPSSQPKLTFIRTLHGPVSPISALSVADGRCVCLCANEAVWVWDLENGSGCGAELLCVDYAEGQREGPGTGGNGSIAFDDRRVVSSTGGGVVVRRFDV